MGRERCLPTASRAPSAAASPGGRPRPTRAPHAGSIWSSATSPRRVRTGSTWRTSVSAPLGRPALPGVRHRRLQPPHRRLAAHRTHARLAGLRRAADRRMHPPAPRRRRPAHPPQRRWHRRTQVRSRRSRRVEAGNTRPRSSPTRITASPTTTAARSRTQPRSAYKASVAEVVYRPGAAPPAAPAPSSEPAAENEETVPPFTINEAQRYVGDVLKAKYGKRFGKSTSRGRVPARASRRCVARWHGARSPTSTPAAWTCGMTRTMRPRSPPPSPSRASGFRPPPRGARRPPLRSPHATGTTPESASNSTET